jgi:hypothetical protein
MRSRIKFVLRLLAVLVTLTLVTFAITPSDTKQTPYASVLANLTVGTAHAQPDCPWRCVRIYYRIAVCVEGGGEFSSCYVSYPSGICIVGMCL